LKASYGGGGWLKTSEYHHMWGGGLKLHKKCHVIFERSPTTAKKINENIKFYFFVILSKAIFLKSKLLKSQEELRRNALKPGKKFF